MNPERFIALRLKELGLYRRVRFLPYMPFSVRAPDGSTRWAKGEFDEELGYFVKYPQEKERSEITRRFSRDQASWRAYLSPVRGAFRRRRLRKANWNAGLFDEHPFPRIHDGLPRAKRWIRWTISRAKAGRGTKIFKPPYRRRRGPGSSPQG
jgi:hypothetical protein